MNDNKQLLITDVNIVLLDQVLEDGWILIQNGLIAAYGSSQDAIPEWSQSVEQQSFNGFYVAPGFIDIHVHGGANFDFMNATEESLDAITRFHMRNGTTAMLATTVTASREQLTDVLSGVAAYKRKPMPYAQIIGVHLEGPFVNPIWKGAQNDSFMINPQIKWLEDWIENFPELVKIQTIAPELEGAIPYISLLHKNGIVAACGHTDASFDDVQHALTAGLSHAVHAFNAMRPLHHREPGVVGAVMFNSNITAEIIADGQHVHPAAIRILIQVKGVDRVVLITDAMAATGMPDGEYELGDLPVIVHNEIARLKEGGSLAGSTLTMIKGFQYLIHEVGLSIIEASRMASLNPAKVIGISDRYGSIEVGKRADLLLLDGELQIQSVLIEGEFVV